MAAGILKMSMQNNKNRLRVDYLHEIKEQDRLITYLRDENIRRLSGEEALSGKIRRRRSIVILLAAALFLIGSYFLFV